MKNTKFHVEFFKCSDYNPDIKPLGGVFAYMEYSQTFKRQLVTAEATIQIKSCTCLDVCATYFNSLRKGTGTGLPLFY